MTSPSFKVQKNIGNHQDLYEQDQIAPKKESPLTPPRKYRSRKVDLLPPAKTRAKHMLWLDPLNVQDTPKELMNLGGIKLNEDSPLNRQRKLPEFNDLLSANKPAEIKPPLEPDVQIELDSLTDLVSKSIHQQKSEALKSHHSKELKARHSRHPHKPKISDVQEDVFSKQQRPLDIEAYERMQSSLKTIKAVHRLPNCPRAPNLHNEIGTKIQLPPSRNINYDRQANNPQQASELVLGKPRRASRLRRHSNINEHSFPNIENRKSNPPDAPVMAPNRQNANASINLWMEQLTL